MFDGTAALAARLREVRREGGDLLGGVLCAAHDGLQIRDKFIEILYDLPDLIVALGVHPLREIAVPLCNVCKRVCQHSERAQNLREYDEECAAHDDEGEQDDDLLYGLGGSDLFLTCGVVCADELIDLGNVVRDGSRDLGVRCGARLRAVRVHHGGNLRAVGFPARLYRVELRACGRIVRFREVQRGIACIEPFENLVVLGDKFFDVLPDRAGFRVVRRDETRGEPRELVRLHAQRPGGVHHRRVAFELVERVEVESNERNDEDKKRDENGEEFDANGHCFHNLSA